MSAKKAAKSAAKDKGRRVIALQAYGSHPYGHEFVHPENAELTALVKKGVLRYDDRGATPPSPTESPPPAEDPAE